MYNTIPSDPNSGMMPGNEGKKQIQFIPEFNKLIT